MFKLCAYLISKCSTLRAPNISPAIFSLNLHIAQAITNCSEETCSLLIKGMKKSYRANSHAQVQNMHLIDK